MLFDIALGLAGIVAGAIASVAGFGIGSVLTPLLAVRVGTRVAVAAISIPHVRARCRGVVFLAVRMPATAAKRRRAMRALLCVSPRALRPLRS